MPLVWSTTAYHGTVTFSLPEGGPRILSCYSPYELSEESEGCAVWVGPQRLLQDPPPRGFVS